MSEGLTMVLLIRSDSDAPDATAHSLGWVIRGELAGEFAEGMTRICGQPRIEALRSVSDIVADAQRDDREVIYTPGGDDA
jgi:hypothetical protein